jgi:tetratricopeptide (TPR) repeat protein
MTEGPAPTAAVRPQRSRPALFWVLGAVGIVVVIYLATQWFGHVVGEEFCADAFCRRSFHYVEIPLLHIQVWPISRSDATKSLERTLQAKRYVPAPSGAELRWDLVSSARLGTATVQGDAAILCAYLDAVDEDDQRYWENWTNAHPELAQVLWPTVARVAHQRLYIFIPELMDLARSVPDAESLRREIARVLTRNYARLAEVHRQLGDPETAAELYGTALEYNPGDADLQRRCDEVRQALGPAPTG